MHNGLSREQVEMGSIVFGDLDRAIDVPMINPMWSNVKCSGNRAQGLLVYPKCPYCTVAFLRERSSVKEGKDAVRVHQEALISWA